LPPTTSGLEKEWDYSGKKGRDAKVRKHIKQVRKGKTEKYSIK